MPKFTRSTIRTIVGFLVGLFVVSTILPSLAVGSPPSVSWVVGGKPVTMGDNLATLNLPPGYLFANGNDAAQVLEYLGNPPSQNYIGLVAPHKEDKEWFAVYSFDPMGYVKDDEAQSIDKQAILESIKNATEADNKKRLASGTPSLKIMGWNEEPHYDSISHSLIWAIAASEGDDALIVNYNTRKLGRRGVTSINLVTTPDKLATLKPTIDNLVNTYEYMPGNKYSDYVAGKDKEAEIGLMALIAGGAAAKSGIFAKILLFLAVIFKKGWIFIAIAIGALLKQLSGKKSVERHAPATNEPMIGESPSPADGEEPDCQTNDSSIDRPE